MKKNLMGDLAQEVLGKITELTVSSTQVKSK